jgi:hypothetical protein
LYNHFGNQFGGFLENWEYLYLKTQLYHSWEYTQRIFNLPQEHLLSYVYVALFIMARNMKEPKCPLTEEDIQKM